MHDILNDRHHIPHQKVPSVNLYCAGPNEGDLCEAHNKGKGRHHKGHGAVHLDGDGSEAAVGFVKALFLVAFGAKGPLHPQAGEFFPQD